MPSKMQVGMVLEIISVAVLLILYQMQTLIVCIKA